MTAAVEAPTHRRRVAKRLGVSAIFKRGHGSAVAVHDILQAGLPRHALLKAMRESGIPMADILPALGISTRTYMRLQSEPDKRLDADQSGRVWRFAELLSKAADVLGTSDLAVEWMLKPAMALEHRRPIELLTTAIGAQLVDDVIERMRYGVYQ